VPIRTRAERRPDRWLAELDAIEEGRARAARSLRVKVTIAGWITALNAPVPSGASGVKRRGTERGWRARKRAAKASGSASGTTTESDLCRRSLALERPSTRPSERLRAFDENTTSAPEAACRARSRARAGVGAAIRLPSFPAARWPGGVRLPLIVEGEQRIEYPLARTARRAGPPARVDRGRRNKSGFAAVKRRKTGCVRAHWPTRRSLRRAGTRARRASLDDPNRAAGRGHDGAMLRPSPGRSRARRSRSARYAQPLAQLAPCRSGCGRRARRRGGRAGEELTISGRPSSSRSPSARAARPTLAPDLRRSESSARAASAPTARATSSVWGSPLLGQRAARKGVDGVANSTGMKLLEAGQARV